MLDLDLTVVLCSVEGEREREREGKKWFVTAGLTRAVGLSELLLFGLSSCWERVTASSRGQQLERGFDRFCKPMRERDHTNHHTGRYELGIRAAALHSNAKLTSLDLVWNDDIGTTTWALKARGRWRRHRRDAHEPAPQAQRHRRRRRAIALAAALRPHTTKRDRKPTNLDVIILLRRAHEPSQAVGSRQPSTTHLPGRARRSAIVHRPCRSCQAARRSRAGDAAAGWAQR